MDAKFKVGELVRDLRREDKPFGIVTRGDYIGNWIVTRRRPRGAGSIHVDVLIEGKEHHCLPEWLEKAQ